MPISNIGQVSTRLEIPVFSYFRTILLVVATFVLFIGLLPHVRAQELTNDHRSTEGQKSKRLLIGLIDTGFDIHHPDLRIDGKSRILRLWDQRDHSKNNGPDQRSAVYDNTELDTDYKQPDREGHGTASASALFSTEYGGMPAEGDLVCVCIPEGAGPERVVEAIVFIRATAEELGRPYLLNLSIGFSAGARDGQTDELEYAISDHFRTDSVGLFRQAITAAGNFNYDSTAASDLFTAHLSISGAVTMANRRAHARGHRRGSFRVIMQTTPEAADDLYTIEIWYPANKPYTIAITAPNQAVILSAGPGQVWVPEKSHVVSQFGSVEITDRGSVQGPGPEPPLWASTIIVFRDDTTGYGPLHPGTWTIELLAGEGTWDAYVTEVNPRQCVKSIIRDDVNNECTLANGANCAEAITVGAYNPCSVCSWVTHDGHKVSYDGYLPANTISHFSSRGPTRAGVDKPDLYAPGQCRKVALSKNIDDDIRAEIEDNHLKTDDDQHWIAEGTSYAAPYVTALVSRLLTIRPCLTPRDIKQILVSTADFEIGHPELLLRINSEKAIKAAKAGHCN